MQSRHLHPVCKNHLPLHWHKILKVQQNSRPAPVEPPWWGCRCVMHGQEQLSAVPDQSLPACAWDAASLGWQQDSRYTSQAKHLLVLSEVIEGSCYNASKFPIIIPLYPFGLNLTCPYMDIGLQLMHKPLCCSSHINRLEPDHTSYTSCLIAKLLWFQ